MRTPGEQLLAETYDGKVLHLKVEDVRPGIERDTVIVSGSIIETGDVVSFSVTYT